MEEKKLAAKVITDMASFLKEYSDDLKEKGDILANEVHLKADANIDDIGQIAELAGMAKATKDMVDRLVIISEELKNL